MNDVILNKVAIIERCIKRIHEEYQDNPENREPPSTYASLRGGGFLLHRPLPKLS